MALMMDQSTLAISTHACTFLGANWDTRFKYKRSHIKSELQQLTLKHHHHSIDIIFSGHKHTMNEWQITSVNIIMCNNKAQPRNLEKTKTKQKKPIPIFAPP
jgi:hypothetical protein